MKNIFNAQHNRTFSNINISVKTLRNFRIDISMTKFLLLYSLYFGFVLNTPITSRLIEITADTSSWLFVYTAPVLLSCAFIIIFSLFAIPYFAKPFFIFVLVSSAAACYATSKYGVLFDYSMIENVIETNSSEMSSYVNLSSSSYLLFVGIIPAILIAFIRFNTQEPLLKRAFKRLILVISAILILLLIAACFYKSYASVGRNNSYLNKMIVPAHIFNSVKYLKKEVFTEKLAYKAQGTDAVLPAAVNGKPTLMVLIVGETARSMNIGYNGYTRNTNPYTQNMGIISFQDVSSCGTATAHSLPCMFSNLNRNNYDKNRANSQDNVLDVLTHAGIDTLWKDNDGGDKSVAKNIKKITIDASQYADVCNGSTCYDEAMLKSFDDEIANMKENKLIAMHMIGSHGPTYWLRYPQQKELFTPSCNQSDIENCSDEKIVNVYDNTIAYTDYVIAETIKKLQRYSADYNVALMYISDHGESLGEKGLYLHGTPYSFAPEEQTQVPFFMWLPQQYADAKGINKRCLMEKAKTETFSHDNLFHTLLGFYGVESNVINPRLDITASCRL
ncbi:Phosphatidylethanolamine:Kdo2-lipid A phosphoethanolamine transferase [Moritella viscosa]|uniref:phosphoethanolamine transferase n=1 Tax=Moritella viscosa TaxID=80854 RepID=UPI0005090729|nr:phosphoethanolamine--lipid A transferase [Moritella viscosa]CED61855.1 membrane associated sulfatase [Moritella viscosa]SHO06304.1 Phosphatidylethanolamine:Kdo2-lipid A phosphoethanolamine transferase [Moritella viscosa]SHO07173.1 Phosphatidylethanolamine:Kdo2-lipid A phosphoethanolamine transferase [Moritella viscosa]SHO09837.1 Phosphatidylethanolamine:Kdo2-lipid A phosphoethanolamine transferase [Moritella viscosa]SHO14044.1 Phosphatidylethanolamine:Kdo2-lipid A phosphoethanolamine transf